MKSIAIRDHSHSFRHALDGIIYTFKNHSNLKTHLVIGSLAIFLGLYLNLNLVHWAIICFTILLVIVCEMINTSLEALGDAITLTYNQEIKIAKDISAGMVLLSSIGAVIIGMIVYIPYLIRLFFK